jgi:integrase/recombinase XerD
MARRGDKKSFVGESNPDGFAVWTRRLCEHMRVRNYSERTIAGTERALRLFVSWADDRGLERPAEVTKPILEHYQRWLFYYRKSTGKPLTFSSQRERLQKLKNFFKWLARQNAIPSNPASDLDLPRVERRIPRAILSEREIDKVLAQPDLSDPLGVRDRTMMEVLYSTGLRRHELAALELFDVDTERGTVTVRQGKGKRDRVVPIGERALGWIARYIEEARSELIVSDAERTLFVNEHGERFNLGGLTNLMRWYVNRAKVGKHGACHIFRHTMATHMLEGGADIRHIQEILGHAETSTTAIYTRVSIRHLKRVHEATHPAAKSQPAAKGSSARRRSEATTEKSARAAPHELARGGAAEDELFSSLVAEARDELPGGEEQAQP